MNNSTKIIINLSRKIFNVTIKRYGNIEKLVFNFIPDNQV